MRRGNKEMYLARSINRADWLAGCLPLDRSRSCWV